MHTYTCEGFRPVKADNPKEAVQIFAERQARRDYGKRGYCRTATQIALGRDVESVNVDLGED